MLLPGQQVTSACVQVFIKCMHEKLVEQGRIEDFGFLCPVDQSPTLKQIINNGMTTFQRTVKKRRGGFDLKDPKWYQPKTRRQPPESNLCAPYVMKHIYDIVTEGKD
ncbi:hypothetical protein K1719_032533 [Acacia pycnantha]|nr:hypothetical protein K1719_032533 [Acacia pycnantha]